MNTARRPWNDRVFGIIWGALVTAAGILMLLTYSGYSIDMELVTIVGLVAVGGWLALSAAITSRK